MSEYFVVFTFKLAIELVKRGFEIKKTLLNTLNHNYFVFYFDNTEELRAAVSELLKQ